MSRKHAKHWRRKPQPITGLSTRERNIIAAALRSRAESEAQDAPWNPMTGEPEPTWRMRWIWRLAERITQ